MDSLKHALRLNNEGVRLLLTNKDHESVNCFTQSLNLVKQALDLAKISQGLLKGEELTAFVKRSFELIK